MIFVGDTLFAMGCGRLFEGTAEQMYRLLQRIAALPEARAHLLRPRIYAGERPLRGSRRARQRCDRRSAGGGERAARRGRDHLADNVAEERATNPFVRAADAEDLRGCGATKTGFVHERERSRGRGSTQGDLEEVEMRVISLLLDRCGCSPPARPLHQPTAGTADKQAADRDICSPERSRSSRSPACRTIGPSDMTSDRRADDRLPRRRQPDLRRPHERRLRQSRQPAARAGHSPVRDRPTVRRRYRAAWSTRSTDDGRQLLVRRLHALREARA